MTQLWTKWSLAPVNTRTLLESASLTVSQLWQKGRSIRWACSLCKSSKWSHRSSESFICVESLSAALPRSQCALWPRALLAHCCPVLICFHFGRRAGLDSNWFCFESLVDLRPVGWHGTLIDSKRERRLLATLLSMGVSALVILNRIGRSQQ